MKPKGILLKLLTRIKPTSDRVLRKVAARNVLTLSSIALLTLISLPAGAQESPVAQADSGEGGLFTDHPLEGVWDLTVTIRDSVGNPLRSFRAMNMYIRGGQLEEFGVGTPPGQRGPGMGIWQFEGRDRYNAVLEFFRFNVDGTFAGTQKVTRTIQLGVGENSFTSTAAVEILDINGQLIQSLFATETATRFQ